MTTEAVALDLKRRRSARMVLVTFALLCIAPIAASYFFYYVVKPDKRTNYGELIEPQRPVPALAAVTLAGAPYDLAALSGRWVMISVDQGDCADSCARKLFEMRQIRIATGKDRDRVELVWLISDDRPVPPSLLAAYPNTVMLRVDRAAVAAWLPADDGLANHLFLVDPHQHLMMRFPGESEAASDPKLTHFYRIKRDLSRLLNNSEIG